MSRSRTTLQLAADKEQTKHQARRQSYVRGHADLRGGKIEHY